MFLSFSFISLALIICSAFAELQNNNIPVPFDEYGKPEDGTKTDPRSFYNVEILGSMVRHEDCIVNIAELDLMFVVDVGSQFSYSALENVKSFIMSTLKPFELEKEKVNVGVKIMGTAGSRVSTILDLSEGISHRAVQDGLDLLQKGTGNFDFVTALDDVQETMDRTTRDVSKVVVFMLTSSWIRNVSAALASPAMSRGSPYSFYYITVGTTADGNIQLLHGQSIYEQNYWTLLQSNAVVAAMIEQYGCNHCASKPCKYGQHCIPQEGPLVTHLCTCLPGVVTGACDPCISSPCAYGTCITTGFSYTCDPCVPQPCMNDGKCFKLNGTAYCECAPGYIGSHCQYKCPACQNGGECILGSDRAICRCLDGSISETCGCSLLITCLNGGTCDFVGGQPICRCQTPFYGPTCAKLCDENTCKNGGRCGVGNNSTTCYCPPQFEGKMCELDKCDSYFSCKNGGVCEVHVEAFHVWCRCVTPFSGVDCSITPCSNHTCLSGGVCELDFDNFAVCSCSPPFSGRNCELHPCDSYSCHNGGTCTLNERFNPMCRCMLPFLGDRCQITPCTNNPCLNGGACRLSQSFQPICVCTPPYSGVICQDSPCSTVPCRNGGTCRVTATSYSCQCLAQFSGSQCQDNLCSANPCQNGGHCHFDGSNYPLCECEPLYTGERCQFHICSTFDCINGGVCRVVDNLAVCDCPPQFIGDRCQFNPCANYLCANDGTCQLDSNNSAFCVCIRPFSGRHCRITPCSLTNPCQNGGICEVDFERDFTCTCPEGYWGDRCEYTPCSSQPCHNAGTCTVAASSFRCTCKYGYWGDSCLFNPCSPNPCFNSGTCNAVSSADNLDEFTYNCTCTKTFTGPRCAVPVAKTACSSRPCVSPCICKPSCMHSEGYVCVSEDGRLGKTCSIPPPQLQCRSDRITVAMDYQLMRELQGDDQRGGYFFLAGNDNTQPSSLRCRSITTTNNGSIVHKLSIPSPFTTCETRTFVNEKKDIVISNSIWFNVGGLQYDMPIPVLRISCNFSSEYNVSISINPIVDDNRINVRRTSTVTHPIEFELCKAVSTCSKTCPSYLNVQPGAVYTVGQFINSIFKLPMVSGKAIDLVDFYASCGETDQSPAVIDLIKDGCPMSDIALTVSTTTSSICVMFQVHRLMNCGVVYLHARLAQCGISAQLCQGSTQLYRCINDGSRKRRSPGKEVSFGPVFILQRPDDDILSFSKPVPQDPPKNFLESDSDTRDFPAEYQDNNSLMLIVFGSCVILSVVCIIVSLFYYSYRK